MDYKKSILIGSLPFSNETEAMKIAFEKLSNSLISIPDGEIGKITEKYPNGARAAWIMTAIDRCSADTDSWSVIKERGNIASTGYPADYSEVELLKPKRTPKEMIKYISFGYDDYFESSYPIFKKLKGEFNNKKINFLLGVPTGLGVTFATMKPITSLRYAETFNEEIAIEVNRAIAIADDDLVIQIEIPGELKMASTLPSFLIGLSTRGIFSLIKKLDKSANIGIHICLGDLNNIALINPKNLKKLVKFSNHLVQKWPSGYKLKYIHFPLAEASIPPTTDKNYYKPLKDVVLPEGVEFVAGFVHEGNSNEDNMSILKTIENIRQEKIAVAHSCGLGRRTREKALLALDALKYVVEN